MRPVRALLAATLTATVALASGCGSEPAPQLAAFRAPEAYLPPIAPEAAPASVAPARTARRATPAAVVEAEPEPQGAPTDAEIAAELKQAFKGGSGGAEPVDAATVGSDGLATTPLTAPPKVRAMIEAANQVATKPYVYGGGHGGGPEGVFTDSAYDCSGSISYALASADFIDSPLASGPMMTWGKPGKGKWVTMYANEGHAFMVVAGLRFDTSGRAERGTRWQAAGRSTAGFVARHPPGL
jgi:cell wall-associated NlpC family hydrolase